MSSRGLYGGWIPRGFYRGSVVEGPAVFGRECSTLEGEVCGIPHLAKNERDAPNFLYATLDRTAWAPFIKERRK